MKALAEIIKDPQSGCPLRMKRAHKMSCDTTGEPLRGSGWVGGGELRSIKGTEGSNVRHQLKTGYGSKGRSREGKDREHGRTQKHCYYTSTNCVSSRSLPQEALHAVIDRRQKKRTVHVHMLSQPHLFFFFFSKTHPPHIHQHSLLIHGGSNCCTSSQSWPPPP